MMLSHSSFLLKFHDFLHGNIRIRLNLFVSLSRLFIITWTVLESNGVHWVPKEEYSKILCYSNELLLIWMNCGIKDALNWMDSISNDNHIGCIHNLDSLVNPIFNSKKFSLSKSNIYGMMNCFLDFVEMMMYMQDRCSNIVLNTSVRYNNNRFGIQCYI